MKTNFSGVPIPFEVADAITMATLIEHHGYLREEVRQHVEEGGYMHPEDYHNSVVKFIPAMELLIGYFGGDYES